MRAFSAGHGLLVVGVAVGLGVGAGAVPVHAAAPAGDVSRTTCSRSVDGQQVKLRLIQIPAEPLRGDLDVERVVVRASDDDERGTFRAAGVRLKQVRLRIYQTGKLAEPDIDRTSRTSPLAAQVESRAHGQAVFSVIATARFSVAGKATRLRCAWHYEYCERFPDAQGCDVRRPA